MPKNNMNDLVKRRVAATQQASELQASDEAYAKLFREPPPSSPAAIRDLPLDKLYPFSTADIGFKPYPPTKLKTFTEQLSEEGLMVRIIVRPITEGSYEILAGHNRANAARLAGWATIPAEIVEADDARAIVIATSTNLIQRQECLPLRLREFRLTANSLRHIWTSWGATENWKSYFWSSCGSAWGEQVSKKGLQFRSPFLIKKNSSGNTWQAYTSPASLGFPLSVPSACG